MNALASKILAGDAIALERDDRETTDFELSPGDIYHFEVLGPSPQGLTGKLHWGIGGIELHGKLLLFSGNEALSLNVRATTC